MVHTDINALTFAISILLHHMTFSEASTMYVGIDSYVHFLKVISGCINFLSFFINKKKTKQLKCKSLIGGEIFSIIIFKDMSSELCTSLIITLYVQLIACLHLYTLHYS